jgi:hypothetical protein
MTTLHLILIFVSGIGAGMMNAIAGGGTLLTFPALVWHGLPPIIANASNTVALAPGALSSAWGYRREIAHCHRLWYWLLLPSLAGGLIGAMLLKITPPGMFSQLVPYLILFATILFMLQETIQKWLRVRQSVNTPNHRQTETQDNLDSRWLTITLVLQFLTAVYGGYFGAGIGIMMLTSLSLSGMRDIHQMNGIKNLFGISINGIAALYFIQAGIVAWPETLVMMAGAIIGGYVGADLARRLGRKFVRVAVIVIGFAMTISLFLRER